MGRMKNIDWLEYLPSGWRALYQDLITNIAVLDPKFEVEQVKEKFGELRVRLARFDPQVYELIDAVSRASRTTCQTCGDAAVLCVDKGLYATLCSVHRGDFCVAVNDPIVASVRVIDGRVEPVRRGSEGVDD